MPHRLTALWRLSQTDIGKSHIIQCLDLPLDGRKVFKEGQCLLHRHVQHIVYALSFIFHFQGLSVVALSLADFTGNVHIREEVHLDLKNTVTAAGLTSSAFYIEAESAFFIASGLGIRGGCKKGP